MVGCPVTFLHRRWIEKNLFRPKWAEPLEKRELSSRVIEMINRSGRRPNLLGPIPDSIQTTAEASFIFVNESAPVVKISFLRRRLSL